MPESIPLPGVNRTWKVRVANDIDEPKVQTSILTRAATLLALHDRVKKTETFKQFRELHPKAEIVEVVFMGQLE